MSVSPCAYRLRHRCSFASTADSGWLHGLKVVAAAVVGLMIFPETAPSSVSHVRFPVKKST
jgi:hypothetical protein